MRIIAVGDKVRYQIFRHIKSGTKSTNSSFQTERLGVNTIRIVSDYDSTSETVFYSMQLPLATEIVFPAESRMYEEQIGIHDKIVFFDEFPYRTQEELESLKQYMEDNCTAFCEVVVAVNNRKCMESDLTTEETAAKSAYEKYLKEGFCVKQYNIQDDAYDFLFCNNDFCTNFNAAKLRRKIKDIKSNVFDSFLFNTDYELEYIREFDISCSNPAFLDGFFSYHACNNGTQNSTENFIRRFWVSDSVKQYIAFADKMYGKYIKEICVWDYQKDLKLLHDKICIAFKMYFKGIRNISYNGTEEQYSMWLFKNKNIIVQIKERIVNFFKTQLREEITRHIKERIEKLEGILCEETV